MDYRIITRVAVNGGFTAVWKHDSRLCLNAVVSVGKGETREQAVRNLIQQVTHNELQSMMPFHVENSSEFHPV